MADVEIKLEPDDLSFRSLARAFRDEADGKKVRRDLIIAWRAIGQDAAEAAQDAIRSAPMGRSTHAVPLREAIASGVRVHTSLRRDAPGVAIKWHRSGMAKARRGKGARRSGEDKSILWSAGRLLNDGRRWAHPVFGRGQVVTGVPGARGWFHGPLRRRYPAMEAAVGKVYRVMVRRITSKSRG